MERPRVSVIVPARDAARTLPALLDALHAQSVDEAYEVIVVVDDTSTDDTVNVAQSHKGCPHVVHRQGLPAGAARNLGVAAAKGEILAFTDADCVPRGDWIACGLDAIAQLDIVQGAVLPDPSTPMGPFDRSLHVVSEYGLYETANLFVRRELFDRLGQFEDLALADERPFGEDSYFVWRARRTGARVGFSAEALVHHAVLPGSTSGYIGERARRRYFPRLVHLVPELRDVFLYKRIFLSAQTAAFDAALLSALISCRLKSPGPLVLALPYLTRVRAEVRRWPHDQQPNRAELALAFIAADAVSWGALLLGSALARAPVL